MPTIQASKVLRKNEGIIIIEEGEVKEESNRIIQIWEDTDLFQIPIQEKNEGEALGIDTYKWSTCMSGLASVNLDQQYQKMITNVRNKEWILLKFWIVEAF